MYHATTAYDSPQKPPYLIFIPIGPNKTPVQLYAGQTRGIRKSPTLHGIRYFYRYRAIQFEHVHMYLLAVQDCVLVV